MQTGLDAYYLLAGGELPAGMTHAQYAQRGAYPLLATAILAALFVLATFGAGRGRRDMRIARLLVYLWLLQNLFLMGCAAWRLGLYVEAFTLTRWRVAAMIWMALVLCGLVWILLRIISGRSNLWLINVNAVTTAMMLYACALVDFDRWIAEYNVVHCRELRGHGPPVDLRYLESLGYDALPGFLALSQQTTDPDLRKRISDASVRLRRDLAEDQRDWRGWTWRRERLANLQLP
jgi:hypothetical protein